MKRLLVLPVLIVLFLAGALFAEEAAQKEPEATDLRQAFISGALVVKGEGAAPQGDLTDAQKRVLALRSAKVVALREATEIINGVRVTGETTVVNAASQSDIIRTAVRGIVKGSQVIKETYDPISGTAVVFVSIPLAGPNGLVGQLVPQMGSILPGKNPEYRPESDAVLARGYDGLIVDCGDLPFKPALINRILTKDGEVIYDPSALPQNVLVEKGAAGYTNDVEKARALLADQGSKNPLVVRAAGIVKSTDAEVAPEDARIIFGSNQDNNYLQAAKVIFVLK